MFQLSSKTAVHGGALFAASVIAATVLPTAAWADAQPGEIWVTLKGTDYAKPFHEGSEFEDHEFADNGFKLIIRVTDVEKPWEFELRPSNPELATARFTTDKKLFKVKRIKGKEARLIATLVVKFEKAAAPKKDPPKTDEPKPAEDKGETGGAVK